MIDQEEIHTRCLSDNPEERIKALDELARNFSLMHDRGKAWSDLIQLTSDEDSDIRYEATYALRSAFSYMPDKQQAWNDLIMLACDEDPAVRYVAAHVLGSTFFHMPDKQEAWDDLFLLTSDEDGDVRSEAVSALNSLFPQVPDKQQAWNDLHELTNDKDDLVRYEVTSALGSAFTHVPDKQQAWNDLIVLASDEDSDVRNEAASILVTVFSQVPDKEQAWKDLHKLTNDKDRDIRYMAVHVLGSIFSIIPEKQQAWSDLHRLTSDEDGYVRSGTASVLVSILPQVPEKQQAWKDLHKLTSDKDDFVRFSAALALGSIFSRVSEKQQAWEDLCNLTKDQDDHVRYGAALALGSAFPHVPDKEQACNYLHALRNDRQKYVRTYANHSLGRSFIFQASQAETEEDYKRELEKAIEFFEKAAQESEKDNPSQFCLPFYRSFHAIVFKKHETKEEVEKYLGEAKEAVRDSKNKKLLFEAVENLANALIEVQSLGNLGLEAKKDELSFYRKYCDRAAELIENSEDGASSVTIILKKGLPILDRNIKETLRNIRNKTRSACKELEGTSDEEIICTIDKKVQELVTSDPEETAQYIENIAYTLKSQVSNIPEYILSKIDLMVIENDITKKTQNLEYVIGYIIGQKLKENRVSIEVCGNENNLIINSNGSNICITGDPHKQPNFLRVANFILGHPIISTVIGGIILALILNRYFPYVV